MRSNHGKGVAYARINGRGVVFVTTPGFFLHALDAKTGKPLEGWGGAVPVRRLPEDRLGRPAEGPDRRLGSVAADRAEVRSRQGAAARARLHHHLVAADRRQRRARRRQLRRAGLQPDAHRERAGRHPGLRRARPESSCGSSTSFRGRASSATRRGRTTRGGGPATCRRGRRCRPTRRAASSTSRPTARRSTTTAGSVRATTCSARA